MSSPSYLDITATSGVLSECDVCGAAVSADLVAQRLHSEWHDRLTASIASATRWRPPPRYR